MAGKEKINFKKEKKNILDFIKNLSPLPRDNSNLQPNLNGSYAINLLNELFNKKTEFPTNLFNSFPSLDKNSTTDYNALFNKSFFPLSKINFNNFNIMNLKPPDNLNNQDNKILLGDYKYISNLL